MAYLIGVLIVLVVIFGPSLWVKFVMNRHSSQLHEISGTGG
jgi:heme/copper-type cytochrome/quinol oxidase subunit 4